MADIDPPGRAASQPTQARAGGGRRARAQELLDRVAKGDAAALRLCRQKVRTEPDPEVVCAMARLIGTVGDATDTDLLLGLLAAIDASVVRASLESLAGLRLPVPPSVLAPLLRGPDVPVREAARSVLAAQDATVILEGVGRSLGRADAKLRADLAQLLGYCRHDARALALLVDLLRDEPQETVLDSVCEAIDAWTVAEAMAQSVGPVHAIVQRAQGPRRARGQALLARLAGRARWDDARVREVGEAFATSQTGAPPCGRTCVSVSQASGEPRAQRLPSWLDGDAEEQILADRAPVAPPLAPPAVPSPDLSGSASGGSAGAAQVAHPADGDGPAIATGSPGRPDAAPAEMSHVAPARAVERAERLRDESAIPTEAIAELILVDRPASPTRRTRIDGAGALGGAGPTGSRAMAGTISGAWHPIAVPCGERDGEAHAGERAGRGERFLRAASVGAALVASLALALWSMAPRAASSGRTLEAFAGGASRAPDARADAAASLARAARAPVPPAIVRVTDAAGKTLAIGSTAAVAAVSCFAGGGGAGLAREVPVEGARLSLEGRVTSVSEQDAIVRAADGFYRLEGDRVRALHVGDAFASRVTVRRMEGALLTVSIGEP